ncbi:hypothetical protein [Dyadobacter crusticola]|uniref:hypothetical protein n=1 Tax=Dyadobacter crusticola TaxID=292407 RepID=UPI0004E14C23|nr:hypothetical protein [Dyadobacter crusticola]
MADYKFIGEVKDFNINDYIGLFGWIGTSCKKSMHRRVFSPPTCPTKKIIAVMKHGACSAFGLKDSLFKLTAHFVLDS